MDVQIHFAPTPVPPAPPTVMVMPKQKKGRGRLFGVLVVLALLVGYGVYAYFTNAWPASVVLNEVPWTTYYSSKHALELKLPPTWQGYTASEKSFQDWDTICFDIPRPGVEGLCLIRLVIFTPIQGERFIDLNGQLPTPVFQNEFYIVVAELPDKATALNAFQAARSREVPSILKTINHRPIITDE